MSDPTPADIEAAHAPLTDEEKAEIARSAHARLAAMRDDVADHLRAHPEGCESSFIAGWNEGHLFAFAALCGRFQRMTASAIAARVREAVEEEREACAQIAESRSERRNMMWENATTQREKIFHDGAASEATVIAAAIRARSTTYKESPRAREDSQ